MMSASTSSSMPMRQRRIGERYPIRVRVEWGPVAPVKRRRRPSWAQGFTRDMSLSGLAIESTTMQGVEVGQPITIAIGRTRCRAAVRTVRAGGTSGNSVYGVEYRDPAMVDTVGNLIGDYGFNPRLSARPAERRPALRSENQHYFDRLSGAPR